MPDTHRRPFGYYLGIALLVAFVLWRFIFNGAWVYHGRNCLPY